MTTHELQDLLRDLLAGDTDGEDLLARLMGVSTFEESGVMTTDAGLLLRFDDDTEVQVTLVRSR